MSNKLRELFDILVSPWGAGSTVSREPDLSKPRAKGYNVKKLRAKRLGAMSRRRNRR